MLLVLCPVLLILMACEGKIVKMMPMSMTLHRHYPKVDRSIVEVDFSNLQLLEDAFQARLNYSTYTKTR